MRISLSLLAVAAAAFGFGQTNAGGPGTVSGVQQQYHYSVSGGASQELGPVTAYSTGAFPTFYFPANSFGTPFSSVVCDDLHMTTGGSVNGFRFSYYDPGDPLTGVGTKAVAVGFFDNVGGGDAPPGGGNPLLAAYGIGLPGAGLWNITVDLTGFEFAAGSDIWMCLDWSIGGSTTAGWILADFPITGFSHDYWYDLNGGGFPGYYFFGGAPVANFDADIYMSPEPSTFAAIGMGLAGFFGLRRRRK